MSIERFPCAFTVHTSAWLVEYHKILRCFEEYFTNHHQRSYESRQRTHHFANNYCWRLNFHRSPGKSYYHRAYVDTQRRRHSSGRRGCFNDCPSSRGYAKRNVCSSLSFCKPRSQRTSSEVCRLEGAIPLTFRSHANLRPDISATPNSFSKAMLRRVRRSY